MASLLTGSITKPSISRSFSGSPSVSSFSSSGIYGLECKEWNKVLKLQPLKPMNSQRKHQMIIKNQQHIGTKNTRFLALSRKGSDNYLVNATSEGHSESPKPAIISPLKTLQRNLDAFYRFSRLFAYVGTALSLASSSLLAVVKLSDFSPRLLIGIVQAIAAGFFMHVYNNGVNQLADIEIDKVNKPYLPLASGEFSIETGLILTLSSLMMACWLGWSVGSWPLICFILILFLSATAYSLDVPLLRWKKNAYLAALSIYTMVVPPGLAVYLHIQTFVFGRPAMFAKQIIFAAFINTIFAFVVALSKDIPDVEGDKLHGIQSFAVRFGGKKVFRVCNTLLQIGYVGGILIGLTSSYTWCKLIVAGGHALFSLKLWSFSKSIDTENSEDTTSFYFFVWKLLSAESLLLPFVR